jgi:hypothetical protein
MNLPKIRVTAIDRFDGDAIISFDDSRTAVFSATFLYDSLPQAQELFESELEFDERLPPTQDGEAASAYELMHRLAPPLEGLADLTYLALEEAEHPEKVRFFLRMAEERVRVIRQIALETFGAQS